MALRILILALALIFSGNILVEASEPAQAAPSAEIVKAGGPKKQIAAVVNAILEQLRDPDIPAQQRRNNIRELVRGKFDFQTMAQGALGRYWRKASVTERSHFVALFTKLLEATYLGRVKAYSNLEVVFGEERIRKKRAEVECFIKDGNTDIPITYKLIPRGQTWLVYDVVIENASLVRSYRSSYASIVRKQGMNGLLKQMEEKLNQLKKAPATQHKKDKK